MMTINPHIDPALQDMVHGANIGKLKDVELILQTSGYVVSGVLISGKQCFENFNKGLPPNPDSQFYEFDLKYFEQYDELKEEGLNDFIHLRNVTLHSGNGGTISTPNIRIKLTAVTGFSYGSLTKKEDN